MRDLKRISAAAIVLVVLLRIAIGWQFLYEGLWKIDTLDTSNPWSAEGYLKNAKGPFRSFFRNLTGHPDDLNWLDAEWVANRWDAWHDRFVNHYDSLTKQQKQQLDAMLNGVPLFAARLEQLPGGEEFRRRFARFSRVIRYDPDRKLLLVSGELHLTPSERERLLRLAQPVANPETEEERQHNRRVQAYRQAVQRVYARASRPANAERIGLSFKERLRASLKGDPERAGLILTEGQSQEVIEKRLGDIELYKERLKRYEQKLAQADEDFEWDHLERQWRDIQQLRRKLVGPVKALDDELKAEARKLLTPEQLAQYGPVPDAWSRMDWINFLTMWGLTILGVLLIAGFLTPLAAVAGAGLLMSFYLVVPPWVGVPPSPGPEHAFIVNKNLIEALALLGIAALPTGRWFGVDAIFQRFFAGRKSITARRPAPRRQTAETAATQATSS